MKKKNPVLEDLATACFFDHKGEVAAILNGVEYRGLVKNPEDLLPIMDKVIFFEKIDCIKLLLAQPEFRSLLNIDRDREGMYLEMQHNSRGSMIELFKSFGAKTNPTTKKLEDAIFFQRIDLLQDLLNDATPAILNTPNSRGETALESALGRGLLLPASVMRSLGAKTNPTEEKLTRLNFFDKLDSDLFRWSLEDSNSILISKTLINALQVPVFMRQSKLTESLIKTGKVCVGSDVTMQGAAEIARVIKVNHLVAPITFEEDVKPAVKTKIDAACKLNQADQNRVLSEIGGTLYSCMPLVYMLFDKLVTPEHHAGVGQLVIDGSYSASAAKDLSGVIDAADTSVKICEASVIGAISLDDMG